MSYTERSIMDDKRIIDLLFSRDERALDAISHKYSRMYKGVIRGVLGDERDVEECADDVLLAVWNSIPPNSPGYLSAYICKIARRIGVDRLRYHTSQKRNEKYTVMLSELEDCLPAQEPGGGDEGFWGDVGTVVSDFIKSLDPETEILFVRRYIYFETVKELAERFGTDENRISVKLYRARKKLKKLLEKEGIKI